jgi:hypothetical protein
LTLASMGAGAAMAAPTDRAESEGLFLSGGGAINIDALAGLAGAYGAFPPATETRTPIDATALGLVQATVGAQVLPGNSLLTLGVAEQYQRSDAAGAFASSGLIAADGAIAAGTGAPGENTTLTLGPVVDALGLDDVISDLSLELGAVAAQAQAARTAGGTTVSSDYQIATGELALVAPALGDVVAGLDTTLGNTSAAVNALAGDGGTIDTAAGGILTEVDSILDPLIGGVVDVVDPAVDTAALGLDLGAVLDTVSGTPFTSGPVTITLSTGTVTVDLDELYALNDAAPNTTLLSDLGVNPTIAEALSDILTNQLPTALNTAIANAVDSTAISIDVTAGLEALGIGIGDVAVGIDGTLGDLLGNTGQAPTVSFTGTQLTLLPPLPAIPLDDLLDPLGAYVAGTVLPAIGSAVSATLGTPALETAVTTALTGAVTALQPVLAAVGTVAAITVNVQETPGTFRDARGTDAGSFTQRAARVSIASDAVVVNLASATVRAVPLALPTGLAATPDRGPVTGGTPVTITGTDLDEVTAIDFGGVPATFTLNPDGSISTVAPPHPAGLVDITLLSVDGPATIPFTYFPVTTVATIDPDSGSTEGGDTVTLTGVCFTGATAVLFDGVPGTDLDVVDDSTITVTTPAGAAGTADVTVVNPTECGDATVPDGYTYVIPGSPVITDIDPDRGPETGGTTVTLTGTDFTGTTSVTFDGVEATSFDIVSDTEITAVTPPHAPGVVDVIATNATGASAGYDFEYFDVADIADIEPGIGPEAGGNTVTITGTCFSGATGVTFGGVPATVTSVTDTQITAVVPAGTGVVDVVVVGAGECGTATETDGYEYVPAPVITDLDPAEGPETGGTVVTITGDGLTGTTGVTFDGIEGTGLEVVDDDTIRVTTPAHAPGVAAVTVEHPGGNVDAGDFAFLNVPSIASLTPPTGPEDGGTVVTLTGEGFSGATGVTFDGAAGTTFTVDSDTQITVTSPAHTPATVPVVVTHPDGNSAPLDFTYVAGTEIDAIIPPGGPEAGGNQVTITGVCFTGATAVRFGTTPATSFTVVSDTQIVAVAPAGVGIVDVTVVGAAACGTETAPDAYEYTDDPVIGTIDPTRGPVTGGTVVTITGVNLTGATSVTFDGIPGTGLTVVSDTELTVTAPAGSVGDANVIVTAPAGASDPGVFTYYAVATIGDVDPDSGPVAGGTTVRIVGACFTGATSVVFGGVPATSFTVNSDTLITAVAPAGRGTGAVDVTVTGGGDCGTTTLPGGFTYTANGLAVTGGAGATGLAVMGGVLLLLGLGISILRRRLA